MNLPADIKESFFETLSGTKSVLEFEQWLYADKQFENILSYEDYLDLISYGYKEPAAKYGLFKLLEKHIDKGEYEKWRLLRLLHRALLRDSDLPQILMNFYDLYYKGYGFFNNLGIGYGLSIEYPPLYADSWERLTTEQQQKLLNSFYPALEHEIKKVIHWLESGKVIPTGEKDDYNHFSYIDHRTVEEQQPTAYETDTSGKTPR
ncbi:MAG: hypothetical protein EOO10_23200 [Chitinophagaceae bacterium]|nr:MAG: hypothetical protein EOO10_23200 [Chitinophagaceae bacterium]